MCRAFAQSAANPLANGNRRMGEHVRRHVSVVGWVLRYSLVATSFITAIGLCSSWSLLAAYSTERLPDKDKKYGLLEFSAGHVMASHEPDMGMMWGRLSFGSMLSFSACVIGDGFAAHHTDTLMIGVEINTLRDHPFYFWYDQGFQCFSETYSARGTLFSGRVALVGAPIWFAALVALLYPILVILRGPLRRMRRRKRGRCEQCNYNLTGNTSGMCPECGKAVALSQINSKSGGELP